MDPTLQREVALFIDGDIWVDHILELAEGTTEIALHCRSPTNRERIEELRQELQQQNSGRRVSIHNGNLMTIPAIEVLIHEVIAEHGSIDAVVTSLGTRIKKPSPGMAFGQIIAYTIFVDEQRRKIAQQCKVALGEL